MGPTVSQGTLLVWGRFPSPRKMQGGRGRRAFLLKSEEGDCEGGGGKAELAEGLLGHF